jgi:hypothetical protein
MKANALMTAADAVRSTPKCRAKTGIAGATMPKPTAMLKATAARTETSRGRPAKGPRRARCSVEVGGPVAVTCRVCRFLASLLRISASRTVLVTTLACTITAVVTAGTVTAVGASGTQVTTCANKKTGALRLATKCTSKEKKLLLGQVGPQGNPGTNGVNGGNGKDGATITPTTLPVGTTVTGTYGTYSSGSTPYSTDAVSFPEPFSTEPTAIYVAKGGTNLHCTGTLDAPTAPSGYICFYESIESPGSFITLLYGYDGLPRDSMKRGVAIIGGGGSSINYTYGTWAATG